MSGGGPNPGQLIPTNGPNNFQQPRNSFDHMQRVLQNSPGPGPQPIGSPLSPSGVGQYSDAQRSGPPQVNIPYTPESQATHSGFNPQQNGTLEQDENGQTVRVLRGGQPYTPPPPIAGPSGFLQTANEIPPSRITPQGQGLFDNLGGGGRGYSGRPRNLL